MATNSVKIDFFRAIEGESMNAKQEILELMQRSYNITCNACGQNVRPYLSDIRAILSTHTLEPIDERPFDPTLCGFVATDIGSWESPDGAVIGQGINGRRVRVMDLSFHLANCITIPWPATQSDGERLLKLLGVLK